MSYQAAIFDMDGLLLDTERLALDAFRSALRVHDIGPQDDLFLRMIGRDASVTRALLKELLPGDEARAAFSQTWSDTYTRSLSQNVPKKEGVVEALRALSDIDLPCAVATSTASAVAEDKLQRSGLREFFQSVTCGDQVSRGKPEPDIYLKAAATLNADARACIAFEDSENGVQAAYAAGMTVVQVPDLVPPSEQLRALGHLIAGSLLEGLEMAGLTSHPKPLVQERV